MSLPRIFVSSTFYDLRFIRADLAVLEEQMALEIVRFETGKIPYHTANTLPDACCKEIDNCNVLISVIGGRYGSTVEVDESPPKIGEPPEKPEDVPKKRIVSISRLEVERAIKSGLLLFTFVDAGVLNEYRTYSINKENADNINWSSVDNIQVFDFIEYIYSQAGRNPVFPFNTPREIQNILRLQLSGLFCDLLTREKLIQYSSHIDHVIKSAEKLEELQNRLRNKELMAEKAIEEMTLPSHPFFSHIQKLLGSAIRAYFKSKNEMIALFNHFGYENIDMEVPQKKTETMTYFANRDIRSKNKVIGIPQPYFNDKSEIILPNPEDWKEKEVWFGPSV